MIVLVDNPAVDLGKKSVIFTLANVDTGMNTAAPLANENATCFHYLAAIALYTETFSLTVTAVS